MYMKYNVFSTLIFPAVFFICSCTSPSCSNSSAGAGLHSSKRQTLRIVSWNTETFFDAVNDGTEYSEFKSAKSAWNRDAYVTRLNRLCDVINKLDADVYVFEEIENEGILYDIANRLAANSWNSRRNWNYACFSKTAGDAIGCAVLSRYSLSGMTVHTLDIRVQGEQPPMRPVMEVSVLDGNRPLVLIVNHWKSKSGGEKKTEIWRDWQESLLSERIGMLQGSAVLACGDFNRDIGDFERGTESGIVLLRGARFGSIEKTPVHSPWFTAGGTYAEPGSYWYDGRWERIDHFFTAGNTDVTDFEPETQGAWADSGGKPKGYKVYTGAGYSDHFPIAASIVYSCGGVID
jgi:endonuclease/exonuclease/phosphatase family metal-dependent hydrolase